MKTRFLDTVLREAAIAAAEHGDLPLSDADLLRRFVANQDHVAFSTIVKRHARLVWSVCRQVTAAPGDAEDAFQAVWLALVRHAGTIRKANSLTAWLHGTAYRVSIKANRSAGRRKIREELAAFAESTKPISDSSWDMLLTVVHEEIARLPNGQRTAFVVCELEGVPPGVAASRLGWKPGTLTGRLCQARQNLMTQLTRRGLAPTAALAGCGIGTATSIATVPTEIVAAAASLPAGSAVIPSTIFELAKAATEGTMTKMKLLAAGVLIASAMGLTSVAGVFAQRPGQENAPQLGGGQRSANPNALSNPNQNTGWANRNPAAKNQWEYKVEAMPADRLGLIALLRTRGDEGWEYCGTAQFNGPRVAGQANAERLAAELGENAQGVGSSDGLQGFGSKSTRLTNGISANEGASTELIFKRQKAILNRGANTTNTENKPTENPKGLQSNNTPNGHSLSRSGDSATTEKESLFTEWGKARTQTPANNTGNGGFNPTSLLHGMEPVQTENNGEIRVLKLKHAKGQDAARIAEQLFAGQLTVANDVSTNSLILKGSPKVLDSITAVLNKLDEMDRPEEKIPGTRALDEKSNQNRY